jgi:hypothetical protein
MRSDAAQCSTRLCNGGRAERDAAEHSDPAANGCLYSDDASDGVARPNGPFHDPRAFLCPLVARQRQDRVIDCGGAAQHRHHRQLTAIIWPVRPSATENGRAERCGNLKELARWAIGRRLESDRCSGPHPREAPGSVSPSGWPCLPSSLQRDPQTGPHPIDINRRKRLSGDADRLTKDTSARLWRSSVGREECGCRTGKADFSAAPRFRSARDPKEA